MDVKFNFNLSYFHQQKIHRSSFRLDTYRSMRYRFLELHSSKEVCLDTCSHVFLIAIYIEQLHILWKKFWTAFHIANLNKVSVCNTCQKYKQEQTSDGVCIGCCRTLRPIIIKNLMILIFFHCKMHLFVNLSLYGPPAILFNLNIITHHSNGQW